MNLSKTDMKIKADLTTKIHDARAKLEDAVAVFNNMQIAALADLNREVTSYNEVLNELQSFAEGIAAQIEEAYDSKSEKWQESEKGQALSEFKDAWDAFVPEEVAEFEVEDVELDADHPEEFEQLPESSE